MNAIESIQRLIAKAIRLADGQPIKEIHVLLGELTGLTPGQVQTAFNRQRQGTLAAEATLRIRTEPGRAVCLTCEQEWPAETLGEACQACGSSRTHMVAGHLVHLASLTFAGQGYAGGQYGQPAPGGQRPRMAGGSGLRAKGGLNPANPQRLD
jgi:hydrogenase nickel insertion protein HypA